MLFFTLKLKCQVEKKNFFSPTVAVLFYRYATMQKAAQGNLRYAWRKCSARKGGFPFSKTEISTLMTKNVLVDPLTWMKIDWMSFIKIRFNWLENWVNIWPAVRRLVNRLHSMWKVLEFSALVLFTRFEQKKKLKILRLASFYSFITSLLIKIRMDFFTASSEATKKNTFDITTKSSWTTSTKLPVPNQ